MFNATKPVVQVYAGCSDRGLVLTSQALSQSTTCPPARPRPSTTNPYSLLATTYFLLAIRYYSTTAVPTLLATTYLYFSLYYLQLYSLLPTSPSYLLLATTHNRLYPLLARLLANERA